MFSLQQNWRTRGWNRKAAGVGRREGAGEMAQTMYTHVYENGKIFFKWGGSFSVLTLRMKEGRWCGF
jgi:hypothetical protein